MPEQPAPGAGNADARHNKAAGQSDGRSSFAPPPDRPSPRPSSGAEPSDQVHRTAFTISRIFRRSDTKRITAVSIDTAAGQVFLGLESGHVEEHQLTVPQSVPPVEPQARQYGSRRSSDSSSVSLHSGLAGRERRDISGTGGAPKLRLLAERKASRSSVLSLACLPAVRRIVARTEDGQVSLLPYDSLVPFSLPGVRSAVAAAPDSPQGGASSQPSADAVSQQQQQQQQRGGGGHQHRTRLAVAVKSLGNKTTLLVYAVLSGMDHQPVQLLAQVVLQEPVLGLAWAGDAVVCEVAGGYKIMQSGGRMLDISAQVTGLPFAVSIATTRLALLLFQDSLVLVADASGGAVSPPLLLPSRPVALANSGGLVVAVLEDAVHVHDRSSGRKVQEILFQHDDPWAAASGRLPTADDALSGLVLLATAGAVYCLQPVAPEQQIRELLKSKRFDSALELMSAPRLAEDSGDEAALWVPFALAQAGLLLLQALRFAEACDALWRAGVQAFQPAQLFPLFPTLVSRWSGLVPQASYWGLHGHLTALEVLVHDALELQQATSTFGSRGDRAAAASHDASDLGLSDAAAVLDVGVAVQDAKRCIADYLLEARNDEATSLRDGVDTLLLLLLAETGRAADVEALVVEPFMPDATGSGRDGGGCAAAADVVAAGLERAGRWHALGLLRAARGDADGALDVWKRLAQGTLQESAADSGAVHDAGGDAVGVASNATVAELCRGAPPAAKTAPSSSPAQSAPLSSALSGRSAGVSQVLHVPHPSLADDVVLSHLVWLLDVAPAAALRVLCRRALPIPGVLALLTNRSDDVRWQYVRHLVYSVGVSDAALHTELALELIDCIMQDPPTRHEHDDRTDVATTPPDAVAAAEAGRAAAKSAPAAQASRAGSGRSMAGQAGGTAGRTGSTNSVPPSRGSGSLQRPGSHGADGEAGRGGGTGVMRDVVAGAAGGTAGGTPGRTPSRSLQLRQVLKAHLEQSSLYDAMIILQAIQGTPLHKECVQLHSRLGDHGAALRVLALTLRDVSGAIQYCRTHSGSEGWLLLLDLFLRPGDGHEPQYAAAVRVLGAEGATLNPLKVLAALPDAMPLHLALETLTHMSAATIHKRRQAQVVKSLHRAQNLATRIEKVVLESQAVVVTDTTACRGCQRLLGTTVLHRCPTGVLLCNHCAQGQDLRAAG